MKKFVIILLFNLILFSTVFAWRDNEMEIRVFYNNDTELETLIALDAEGDIYPNGEALLYMVPKEFEVLRTTGLKYKIENEDLKTYAENFWTSMDNTREAYHAYAEIVALADSLVNAFPSICEKHLFGTSVQGRELAALKISDNVTLDENEAEVFFDSGIHGDEIGGPENVIRFARDICRDYGVDPDITDLINNREIWLYYMVNPDGRVADDRTNANGVDLNRDSGYMWDGWGNSTGAFSQPESKALRDCHYNRQFVVHTTYHSGTEYISCPWSYRASQCPDFDHILQLAGEYANSSGYANMEYGQGNSGMYAINGSTKDTNYGMMGAISWSMEISYDKGPPASQIMMFYNYNKPAMLSMIEHAGYGLEGLVTDANTGDPVTAAVFIEDYFPTYTDINAGDYHKYVLPGNYDITIVANGYETQTISGVTVVSGTSTSTDFQLQPLEGQYVYKISASQISGNNEADEGDTPGVIGAPDDRNYSIGKDGWIIVDLQFPIPDGVGNDIKIFEGDTSPEGYSVFASEAIDGPWMFLGDGMGTSEFDLAVGNLIEAQFIKISDDGDGLANSADAGFDLDAIEAIAEVTGTYIAFLGFELDEMVGNGNGYIDPGETMDMLVSVRNNGSSLAEDVEGLLSTNSAYITMNNDDVIFGDITPGQEAFGIFTFTVDEATPVGELLAFDFEVTANNGAYVTNFDIACMVGIAIEDFESNNFDSFEWEFGGNADWTISSDSYEGSYSAQSGDISDNQSTSITLTTEVIADGFISFYRKVSSEQGWDYYNFYIDNNQLGSWSGTSDWVEESYPVTAGNHIFKWEYTKDTSVSSGSDCGWVDYIIFPPMVSNVVPLDPPTNLEAEIVDYNSSFIISWGGVDRSKHKDRDLLGYNIYFDGTFVANVVTGPHVFEGPFAPGDYFIEVTAVYDEGESEAAEITVTIVLNPPENLEAVSNGNDIVLTWSAPTPTRGIVEYKIYRDGTEINTTTETTYTDQSIQSGSYIYEVTVVYDGGYESDPVEIIIEHTEVGVVLMPEKTELSGNYPNPFNPTTTISFSTKEAGYVTLDVYNMRGQLVKTLVNEQLDAAYHNIVWDGRDTCNKKVSSGFYFYKMKSRDYTKTKKMILMK